MIVDPEGVIVYLEITSWQGMSLGAIHFYGKLQCKDSGVELRGKLTERHATMLNEEARWNLYRRGQDYSGFLTKEEIIGVALDTYKKHFPQARALILGKSYSIEAHPILALDGPVQVMDRLNQIAKEAEPLSVYDQEPLTDRWERLLTKTLGLKWKRWK